MLGHVSYKRRQGEKEQLVEFVWGKSNGFGLPSPFWTGLTSEPG
jgi:hypothetical protein